MQYFKKPTISVTFTFLLILLFCQFSNAQFEVLPCDDPDNNGVGCYCETAGVLCTPDLLDGFEFAMSNTENFGDLGDGAGGVQDDLCPGLPADGINQGGVPNNVNFFAFVVWCENLTFNVLVNNCADNPLDNFVTYGIQMALFANCPEANGGTWDPVSCITTGSQSCFNTEAQVPTLQTFSATGLEIGATYYFMVDGCALSTCKVTIDVQGECGTGEITDWDTGLTGPTTVCVGDTETYVAEDMLVGLDGAEEYYYYLNGSPFIDGEELFELDITWDTPGSYELCVDVSNLPCIQESDSPDQNCITVFVNGPGNGEIIADPEILCPDDISDISVINTNPDPNLTEYIIIIGPDGTVFQIVEALSTTLTYDMCGDFTAYYYSFVTADNPTVPSVGDVWVLPDCTTDCCSIDNVGISFQDTEDPTFELEPADFTLDCADDIPTDEELTWIDNCAGTGMVLPTVVENYTDCAGGTVERTWTFVDSCANDVTYTQTITLDPIAMPEFTSLPGDSIINCDTAQIFVPLVLDYSNNGTGSCDISGSISPTSVGSFDICGSTVTYTWEFTDQCNRTITWSQNVTVEEVGAANEFINPPDDVTISCADWLTFTPETLNYSNDQVGSCEISGSVPAVTNDTHDPCGNSITYTWEFTDQCGRPIMHTQVVTVDAKPEATFVNPPDNITIDCDELQTFTPAVLTYTNSESGVCLIEGTVDPVGDIALDICGNTVTYTWDFTDDCGRPISHTQMVTVLPIPEASFVNPPGNITIDCDALQTFVPAVLSYTNSGTGACLIEGTVDAVGDGTLEICGNSVTYTWEFTDQCGRPISHTQIVTTDPIPEANFVNPPGNITIDCDELQTFSPAILSYTNGGTGACLIEGTVDPVGDGTLEICGNSVTYTWEFTDQCGRPISHTQTVTTDPIPEASFVNPPANITINCDDLQSFIPAILNYTNGGTGTCLIEGTVDPVGDGTLDECGNSVTYTWDFTDQCGRPINHTQTVSADPIPEANFVNPPANITINCDDLQTFSPIILTYTNGGAGVCLIEGTVDPVGDGTLDECGNTVTFTWDFTDQCGRPINHTQTVTTDPIPEASYINPPADITLNCDQLQAFTPIVLDYSNSETGDCLIEGTVDPVGDGTLDECGNSVTYTWEFTDVCGRPISHTQTVTTEPIPEASFVNPPADITLNCDQLQAFTPIILDYSNNGTGDCLIEGTVDPVGDGTLDECGNSVTYTWEFTDECGRPISHVQTVTSDPIPEAVFLNPPADLTVNCDDLQSFTPDQLMYTNNESGGCLIEGVVDPVGDGELEICGNSVTYTWEFTDDCGRPISHTQTVTSEPIAEPAFTDPPGDITLNCDDLQAFSPATLSYTNGGTGGCLIEGMIDPVGDGTLDVCGSTVTYTWDFTDDCGRPINHTQTVTVEPIAPPMFLDLPSDMTLPCDEKPTEGEGVSLTYTNGGTDACEISGEVDPIENYNVNECGGIIEYQWSFTDDCDNLIEHTQTITIDPAPQGQFENLPPSTITISCEENTGVGQDLVLTNNETGDCLIEETVSPSQVGDADVCGGTYEFLWEFTDDCGRTTSFTQTVNVDPAAIAEFDNIPTDIDATCDESTDAPEDLSYSNGESGDCEIAGTVSGIRSGTVTYCGGELIDTWEFIDDCGRLISTQRTVNVGAADPADYINPPSNTTVDCDNVNSIPTTLNYSNGEGGICLISGVSNAVISGSYDNCGGELIYTWSFVDDCGRPISHSQNITVDPAPDAVFINPPTDLVIDCNQTYTGPVVLNYTNGEGGVCEITGVVIATSNQVDNIITNTWELFQPCSGDVLVHTQQVTLSITPEISINPINVFLCLGDSYDLSEVIVTEANGTTITTTYHDAFPPTPTNEITSVVSPTLDAIYAVNVVNEFGCSDFELVNIFVEQPPFAGGDQSTTVCSDGFSINLFDYIFPTADMNGSWLDLDGIGANISNPNAATFNNVPPGIYDLYYVVYSTNVCENDTMVLTVEVIDDFAFEITEVTCIGSNDFYEVYINSNGFVIQATEGDLMNISGNEYVVTNIPITTGVFITAFESTSGCSTTEFVDIPNCDCPDIAPPIGSDISICIDEQPITITVTVPAGMTANWFLEQNSATPFLEGSLDFVFENYAAGLYSFFVETFDPATDCSSNVKLKIDVEVNNLPEVMNSTSNICDLTNNGVETVALQTFNNLIGDLSNSFIYFDNLLDAENNTNPLASDVNISIGVNTFYVRVENSANCVSIAELQLILNDLPEATLMATAPACINEENGQIAITPVDVDGTVETSLDGVTYDETLLYTDLSSGTYTVYIRDENGCVQTYESIVPEGLDILFTTFSATCNDNGTNTEPSDDFYTFTLFIENNQGNGGMYNVMFNGSTQFTFEYGVNQSFDLPADPGNTLTITIEDVNFICTKEQTFGPLNPCSTNCEVSIDLLDFDCQDNGTETDPADDFYIITINASASNGAVNNTYNVFLDGVLLYNFMYGVNENFQVPANGNNLNITCQDNEDIQCQISEDIGPLNACSGGCQILLDILSSECSNNGTSTNQNDDFYTFTIQGNIVNGDALSQFELFVDGISQGLFNYDEDVSFDIGADDQTHDITIGDISNTGCESNFTTESLINCSTDCEIILNTSSEMCFNNDTPEDSSDDFYEFTFNLSSVNGASNQLYNLYVDGGFIGAFPYDEDNIVTISADNLTHLILFQDSEILACELDFTTDALSSCSDACLIELSIESFLCFDNNTATVLTDDFYTFELLGTLLNGENNSSYELYVDGQIISTEEYGELINITIAADGADHTILIVDTNDSDCTFEVTTDELIPCSTDCEINLDELLYECFDNGTPTDPLDDYIEITISTSAINGASNNMFNFYIDGVLEGIYSYGNIEVFTLPADGQIAELRIQDSQDLQCDLTVNTEILEPCSDGCLIDIGILNVECFDNDTPTEVNDDYYEITIEGQILNGITASSFEVYLDNALIGISTYSTNYVVTIPADGSAHEILIIDSDDTACTAMFTTDELTSCSTDCEISINDLTFICDDNGTLDDPSDDFYSLSFTTSAINGSAGYSLSVSGEPEGTFNYGNTVQLSYPADGSTVILMLTDLSDNQCIANEVVGELEPCSNLCTIEPMIEQSSCFDNGTPIDPGDDFWELVIFVNPANGETAPTFDLSIDGTLEGTYNYSENITITIAADNMTHQILVADSEDSTCDALVTTETLIPCSTPCEISASISNISCDNNGTNDTGNDDIFTFDLLVNNPSTGTFEIPSLAIQGNYNEALTVGPLNISDGSFIIEILDANQNLCTTQIEITPPSPCSECEQTVNAGVGGTISCDVTEIMLLGSASEEGSYSWFGPAGNLVSEELVATAVSIGTYTFSVLFEDGCTAEDEVEISADTDLPIALVSSDGDITCAKEFTILDGSLTGSTDDYFFYWYNEDDELVSEEQVFETDIAGVYFLQVEFKDNNCLSAREAIIVSQLTNEPVAVIFAEPSNVIDCVIESIILTTDQEENVDYTWSFNGEMVESELEIEISEIGTYGLLAIDTITGCSADADVIISSLVDYPNIMLEAPMMLDCDNDEISIVATSLQSGSNLTSFWQDENQTVLVENQNELTITEPGEYYYTLIDNDNGCENTDSIIIELFENDVDIETESEITYIEGGIVVLSATVNLNQSEIASISWSPSENMTCSTCLNTQINNPLDSIYTVTVVDIYGCLDSAQVRLNSTVRPEVFVPNVFSPNNSAGNNRFVIYGNEEVDRVLKVRIFDRWGNNIYTANDVPLNDPSIGWDGTYKGQNVEQGVYVYLVEALNKNGSVDVYHGDLTVLR